MNSKMLFENPVIIIALVIIFGLNLILNFTTILAPYIKKNSYLFKLTIAVNVVIILVLLFPLLNSVTPGIFSGSQPFTAILLCHILVVLSFVVMCLVLKVKYAILGYVLLYISVLSISIFWYLKIPIHQRLYPNHLDYLPVEEDIFILNFVVSIGAIIISVFWWRKCRRGRN